MGKSKVFYEQANTHGTTQTAGHKALKVQAPKSRKRGRGFVTVQA